MKELETFRAYLINRELSENTIASYMVSAGQFFSSFDAVTKENMLLWKNRMSEQGMKPKTVNLRLNGMCAYCDMVHRPDFKVKRLKIHQAQAVSNVISYGQYQRLLGCLMENRALQGYFMVKLLAMTGARVNELIRITKGDLDKGYSDLWTKGKMRRIYIPRAFREEAAGYYSEFQPEQTLVCSASGRQITVEAVRNRLWGYSQQYGIDKKVMHPHAFRHMFAIKFLENNKNLSLLADVMGHSSVATTAIYTRMTQEQQEAAVSSAVDW